MDRAPAVAVGRLDPDGPWVGFAAARDGYVVVFGDEQGELVLSGGTADREPAAVRRDLVRVAQLYFTDGEPPPEPIAATQGDVADLVRWLATTASDPGERRLLARAVDAIDDGLAADAVMLSLDAAARAGAPPDRGEQVEALDLLVERYRELKR